MPASHRFLVVPEWQASASSRAMRLIDGAEAIRGDLPASVTTTLEVPMEAGESLDTGVDRLSTLVVVRDALAAALSDADGPAIVVGGDAGIELAAVAHAMAEPKPALIWLSARPSLSTPGTSETGAFESMVLATLLGEGADRLVPDPARQPETTVLAGLRTADLSEDDAIAARGIRSLSVDSLSAATLADAVEDAPSVYLHVDLDVLDPSELAGIDEPVPFGVSVAALCEAVKAVRSQYPLAGAGLTGFSPSSPEAATDDLGAILRIISAIAGPRR